MLLVEQFKASKERLKEMSIKFIGLCSDRTLLQARPKSIKELRMQPNQKKYLPNPTYILYRIIQMGLVGQKILSGSFNGEIVAWDLISRKAFYKIDCFSTAVRDMACQKDFKFVLVAGNDNQVKQNYSQGRPIEIYKQIFTNENLNSISLNSDQNKFLAAGSNLQIFDLEKIQCIGNMSWGCDSILQARFNQNDSEIGLCTGIDRGIYLFDLRTSNKLIKTYLMNKSSSICWNPMEPFNFLAGNEDGNIYSFDMRKMDAASKIHKGHIGAVLSLDFNPTGFQFVSGSYDKTIRLFNINEGKSFEVYHSKRMQKIFSVLWSMDTNYIFSGSDETNIRVWKAQASTPVGYITVREQNELQYRDQLLQKYKYNTEISKIQRVHVPKYLLTAKKKQHIQAEKKQRKMDNVKYNNEQEFEMPQPETRRKVTQVEEQYFNQYIKSKG